MDELISRQAAIDAVVNRTVTVDTDPMWLSGHAKCELEIIDIINNLPSAQTEIIYCKDCIHHEYETETLPYCLIKDYGYGWKDTDFCSYAERRGTHDGE